MSTQNATVAILLSFFIFVVSLVEQCKSDPATLAAQRIENSQQEKLRLMDRCMTVRDSSWDKCATMYENVK